LVRQPGRGGIIAIRQILRTRLARVGYCDREETDDEYP
jgi:hypothetical protein